MTSSVNPGGVGGPENLGEAAPATPHAPAPPSEEAVNAFRRQNVNMGGTGLIGPGMGANIQIGAEGQPGQTSDSVMVGGLSELFRQGSQGLPCQDVASQAMLGEVGAPAFPAAVAKPGSEPESGDTAEEPGEDEDALAAGLAGASAAARQIAPQPAAVRETGAASGAAPIDHERCREVVERILVADPGPAGREEVRLRLDRNWLPDTEVRLERTAAGLEVEFMTDRTESQRFLLPHLTVLRERLEERSGQVVVMRLSEQAGDDSHDGRSRNRRSVYEEMSGE